MRKKITSDSTLIPLFTQALMALILSLTFSLAERMHCDCLYCGILLLESLLPVWNNLNYYVYISWTFREKKWF